MRFALIALGANLSGPWGRPIDTLRTAVIQLRDHGIDIVRVSSLYVTAPIGGVRQASYLNAVVLAKINVAPAALLRFLKVVERNSGRRLGVHWGPRTLDLDIVDFGGTVIAWPPGRRTRGRLILPHPEAHKRAFVLVPVSEVMPKWHHPALNVRASTLVSRLGSQRRGVRRVIDPNWISCHEGES